MKERLFFGRTNLEKTFNERIRLIEVITHMEGEGMPAMSFTRPFRFYVEIDAPREFTLQITSFYKIHNQALLQYSNVTTVLLPSPYKANCIDYERVTRFISQTDCERWCYQQAGEIECQTELGGAECNSSVKLRWDKYDAFNTCRSNVERYWKKCR